MNKKKRALITEAVNLLEKTDNIISSVLEQEQDSLDNVPEGLQDTDRYEKMEDAVVHLENALSGIEDVKTELEEAIL